MPFACTADKEVRDREERLEKNEKARVRSEARKPRLMPTRPEDTEVRQPGGVV